MGRGVGGRGPRLLEFTEICCEKMAARKETALQQKKTFHTKHYVEESAKAVLEYINSSLCFFVNTAASFFDD